MGMKLLLRFVKEVLNQWVILLTGTILALLLTISLSFAAKVSLGFSYVVDAVIVVVAFLWAAFRAWKVQLQRVNNLEKKLNQVSENEPKYALSVIDRDVAYGEMLREIDDKLITAKTNQANAPDSHGLLAISPLLGGAPLKKDWAEYVKRLELFGDKVRSYPHKHLMLNVLAANIGSQSDSNINITLLFKNLEFEPDFYKTNIQYARPTEPDRSFTYSLGLGKPNTQGLRREVLVATPHKFVFEINRMHVGDDITASYVPLVFKKLIESKARIEYTIKSSKIRAPIKGTLQIGR